MTAPIAVDAANRFQRLGLNCQYLCESYSQIAAVSLAGPSDAIMAFALDGRCGEILNLLELAKSLGAITMVVTQFGRSPMVGAADIVIYVSSLGKQPKLPTTIHLNSVVDILWQFVALKDHGETVKKMQRVEQAFKNKRR